jgi:hypothetical protein
MYKHGYKCNIYRFIMITHETNKVRENEKTRASVNKFISFHTVYSGIIYLPLSMLFVQDVTFMLHKIHKARLYNQHEIFTMISIQFVYFL